MTQHSSLAVFLRGWTFWAPTLESLSQVQAFPWTPSDSDITSLGENRLPSMTLIPSAYRRRATPVAKLCLLAGSALLSLTSSNNVELLCASQHGESGTTLSLLKEIAHQELLSPHHFSLSVHNATAGLLTIFKELAGGSSALAGGRETVSMALLEAGTFLQAYPEREVLLLIYDDILAEEFRTEVEPFYFRYVLGLLLTTHTGVPLQLTYPGPALEDKTSLPESLRLAKYLSAPMDQENFHGEQIALQLSSAPLYIPCELV